MPADHEPSLHLNLASGRQGTTASTRGAETDFLGRLAAVAVISPISLLRGALPLASRKAPLATAARMVDLDAKLSHERDNPRHLLAAA